MSVNDDLVAVKLYNKIESNIELKISFSIKENLILEVPLSSKKKQSENAEDD